MKNHVKIGSKLYQLEEICFTKSGPRWVGNIAICIWKKGYDVRKVFFEIIAPCTEETWIELNNTNSQYFGISKQKNNLYYHPINLEDATINYAVKIRASLQDTARAYIVSTTDHE